MHITGVMWGGDQHCALVVMGLPCNAEVAGSIPKLGKMARVRATSGGPIFFALGSKNRLRKLKRCQTLYIPTRVNPSRYVKTAVLVGVRTIGI